MEVKKVFFNGLNELRAFAALFVIFHHIELFKNRDGIESLCDARFFFYFIEKAGENGVYLFFVLSGFLITFLLLKEKEKLGTILFKKFYLRRVFRIWPLYYFIIFIGFVLIPFLTTSFDVFKDTSYYFSLISNSENYSINALLLYIFFLPNLALNYFRVVGCTQSWSVGVEEQFYILWPILIFVFSRKKLVQVFLFLLLFLFFLQVFFQPVFFTKITSLFGLKLAITPFFHKVISLFPFQFMAIGAIGGYLFFYHQDKITFFTKSKAIYLLVLLIVFGLMSYPIIGSYVQSVILGVFFLFLILITIDDENKYVFRNRQLSYVGRISYGIYMYHPFIMFLVFPLANKYFPFENSALVYNLFVYGVILALTILLSHFSYKYFESIFINIKDTKYKSL